MYMRTLSSVRYVVISVPSSSVMYSNERSSTRASLKLSGRLVWSLPVRLFRYLLLPVCGSVIYKKKKKKDKK